MIGYCSNPCAALRTHCGVRELVCVRTIPWSASISTVGGQESSIAGLCVSKHTLEEPRRSFLSAMRRNVGEAEILALEQQGLASHLRQGIAKQSPNISRAGSPLPLPKSRWAARAMKACSAVTGSIRSSDFAKMLSRRRLGVVFLTLRPLRAPEPQINSKARKGAFR